MTLLKIKISVKVTTLHCFRGVSTSELINGIYIVYQMTLTF